MKKIKKTKSVTYMNILEYTTMENCKTHNSFINLK